jgi:hypothetical protein
MIKTNQPPKSDSPPQMVGTSALLAMLEATAIDLWRATLAATSTETGKRLFARMRNPEVGDTVIETTTYRRITKDRMGFGTLIAKSDGDNCATEWVIRTPDGQEAKWVNADIIAIPCGSFDWFPPLANDQVELPPKGGSESKKGVVCG